MSKKKKITAKKKPLVDKVTPVTESTAAEEHHTAEEIAVSVYNNNYIMYGAIAFAAVVLAFTSIYFISSNKSTDFNKSESAPDVLDTNVYRTNPFTETVSKWPNELQNIVPEFTYGAYSTGSATELDNGSYVWTILFKSIDADAYQSYANDLEFADWTVRTDDSIGSGYIYAAKNKDYSIQASFSEEKLILTIIKSNNDLGPKITGEDWLNSEPLKPNDLKNKIILVDFWTYSCINCQRTIPYLRNWWNKYKDKDLVIIGIHTPEFDFEKDKGNVGKAIKELGVEWPVVMDNDYANWNQFANKYWPAKYLINHEGFIVYTHVGEGAYSVTEKNIQEQLQELHEAPQLPEIGTEQKEHEHGKVCFPTTPELYLGFGRGHIDGSDFSNGEGYKEEKEHSYKMPKHIREDSFGLIGKFIVYKQFVQSLEEDAKVVLHFKATEVNIVMDSDDENCQVEIMLDGKPIPEEIRGKDLADDNTVSVTDSKLYNLLKSKRRIDGLLQIRSISGSFKAFSFTFSGCEE